MFKTILTLLLFFSLTSQFLIQQQSQTSIPYLPNPTPSQSSSIPNNQVSLSPIVNTQRQGSLTPEMTATLKQLIDNSTQLYRRYRLNDMAVYISKGMSSKFGDNWQTFVFGEDTENCSFAANTVNANLWAVWTDYGIYSLCYVTYKTKSCIKSQLPSGQQSQHFPLTEQQQWGYSFTDTDKQRILFLIDQSQSYGGADMTKNSQYFISKIGSGGWAVAIGGPSNGIGMSTCYYKGYYAFLVDYSDLLWTYAIIREY